MTEQQIQWRRWGQYYGFPECCIEFFLKNAHKDWWMYKIYPKGFKFQGTGYIPCKHCNKLSEQEIMKRINYRRKALTPFPEKGTFNQEQEHLNRLIKNGEIK